MDGHEWLGVLLRWIHVIAGIMWIGDSLLFMWIDRNLRADPEGRTDVGGITWLIHGGGYYQVEKRMLEPGRLPPYLRWFWLESTSTWISGFLLLIVVYYMSASAYMVDTSVSGLSPGQAVAVGLGLFPAAWLVYDGLWRSPLRQHEALASVLSSVLLLAFIWAVTHLLSPRAAFLHVGAVLATIMAANVWVHIIPPQRKMVRAAREGREVDFTLGKHAKARSTHNSYVTFPVIFTMISNHFPALYGNALNWVVLALLFVFGAGIRHLMLVGWQAGRTAAVAAALSVVVVVWMTAAPAAPGGDGAPAGDVSFTEVHVVIARRCSVCHSVHPTQPGFTSATGGVMMDTPDQIKALAARIKVRAVDQKTMPLGNITKITDKERALLGRWIQSGAPLK